MLFGDIISLFIFSGRIKMLSPLFLTFGKSGMDCECDTANWQKDLISSEFLNHPLRESNQTCHSYEDWRVQQVLLTCSLPDSAAPATDTFENPELLLNPAWFCYTMTSAAGPHRFSSDRSHCGSNLPNGEVTIVRVSEHEKQHICWCQGRLCTCSDTSRCRINLSILPTRLREGLFHPWLKRAWGSKIKGKYSFRYWYSDLSCTLLLWKSIPQNEWFLFSPSP